MLQSALAWFLSNGSFRRWLTGTLASAAMLALPLIKAKLGLDISEATVQKVIEGVMAAAVAYIVGSNAREALVAKAEAEAKVKTVDDAVKVLTREPPK